MKPFACLMVLWGCSGRGASLDASPDATAGGVGRVSITNTINTQARGSYTYVAFGSRLDPCVMRQVGMCELTTDCSSGPPHRASAGAVTIAGTRAPVSLIPDGDGNYPLTRLPDIQFSAGDTVTSTIAGATVPASQLVGTASGQATILTDKQSLADIDSSQDLTISWNGAVDGVVEVDLEIGIDSTAGFRCKLPASSQQGTIPKDVLVALRGQGGQLSFFSFTETAVSADPWRLSLRLAYEAIWSDQSTAITTALVH